MKGTADFDWTPLKKRVPDALNAEVYVGDVIVPADVADPAGWGLDAVKRAFVEAKMVESLQGVKFRCIQIHVHYPDAGEYISHVDRDV